MVCPPQDGLHNFVRPPSLKELHREHETVQTVSPSEPQAQQPYQTNVVPFRVIPGSAKPDIHSGGSMLEWKPLRTDNSSIYADTGGLGRLVIRSGDFFVLKHNGEQVGRFNSQDDAMAYAQEAYQAMSRYANDDFEPMATAA
jgi:hypothetical protein